MAVADFDGDGKLDLVVVNGLSNSVSVLLGDGNGNFGAKSDFPAGAYPNSLVTGDFNNDGKADVAVVGFAGVNVLLGDGNGNLGSATTFAAGYAPEADATGDFNKDGKTDLAVTNGSNNSVNILLGDGNGGFGQATSFATAAVPISVAVGDFNGDGKADLATADEGGNGGAGGNFASVLLNSPTPAISVSNVTVDETKSGTPNLDFAVSLSAKSTSTVTVECATGKDSGPHPATVGVVYVATHGKLTFNPGEMTKTVSIPIIGQLVNEPDATLDLNLSNPVNATIAVSRGIGSIVNDFESVPPATLKIVVPAPNSTVSSLPKISGVAIDNAGGSGVAEVGFFLNRKSDGKWWSGSAWVATPIGLLGTSVGNNVYTKTFGLPAAGNTLPETELTDGIYVIVARAFDVAGNQRTIDSQFQVATPIKVACTIVLPKRNSAVSSLPVIQAVTTDSLGGTGVAKVDFYLQRHSDTAWWNGTAWGGTATALPSKQVSSGGWSSIGGLPSPTETDTSKKLTDGIYTVYARPTDKNGVVTTFSSLFQMQTPVKVNVTMLVPARNSTVTGLTKLSAETTDNYNGNGVARVDFYLLRNADSKWWGGTAWGTTAVAIPASVAPTGAWTASSGLPSGLQLVDGVYTVYIRPIDIHGKFTTFSSMFQVKSPAAQPLAGSALLPVSSASASVAGGTITLNFASALPTDQATDVADYSVTTDGTAVTVESVSVNKAGRTVVIDLPAGRLHRGARVDVAYNFAGTAGETTIMAN